ncbi:serine/threonine-protein kinase [Nocardioides sp. cx-173]|uniref:serine/threonine-protein kinase n=1 Tax=Nocardioides sp. cx-173 TaxID=2898796 RepID=UPI001E4C04B6|nr:serine/threonine-protein kinase [Nocardioides sp. cx-173]MCD4527249.1 serine/threonine protein kinase [Nocardioides sp. cx-173]UGB40374.1 serine/threonine protein kinase [Nocardioides sp. cx-173]
MTRADESWHLREGDPITPELTAMRLLGGGSAYEAYLAFDEITYAPVVVKVVRPTELDDEATLGGLAREAAALDQANHPVVVRRLRHELGGARPHLVLEHIDGPRLSTLVRRHGPLQEQQYLPLAVDIASALHYFRHVDVVHLDIKPSNVIMGAPARLIDLSVARPGHRAAELTSTIGTDAYMSPEQCAPGQAGAPGHASDVWGLGATLFEAIAGYRPFDDGDRGSADLTLRYPQLVEEPYALPDGTPADVAKTVYAMLAADPTERPEPREVAGALEPVLSAQPPARLTFKVRR